MNSSNSGLQEWEKDFTPRVIKAKDWEPQRENFTRLYFTDKYNLNDVRRIMAKDYRFYARYKCICGNSLYISVLMFHSQAEAV